MTTNSKPIIEHPMNYSRRRATKTLAKLAMSSFALPPFSMVSRNQKSAMLKRPIPSSGNPLPVIGLGTWQSFDVGNDSESRKQLTQVLSQMNAMGGKVIDSSPMYGSSEAVVGDLTSTLDFQDSFFYATKVWTSGRQQGIDQMKRSMQKMNRKTIDLMQIHNLVDWKTHLSTLKNMKEKGEIKYWGITHYTNASHEVLAQLIRDEKPDFAQFNFSIRERHAEDFLLQTASDNGTAVIINRPFEGGTLFRITKGKALPPWCKELAINSWAQFFLKYILGNDAVNCVIPGTSKPRHVIDNMGAGFGKLPDTKERNKMVQYLSNI